MSTLRQKLLILLAAGIAVLSTTQSHLGYDTPDDILEENRWVIEAEYEEFERAKSQEEDKGAQYPDY